MGRWRRLRRLWGSCWVSGVRSPLIAQVRAMNGPPPALGAGECVAVEE
jgi:hypothetical protein